MADNLHRIQFPALNQASFGPSIVDQFKKIDENFQKLSNLEMSKGAAGKNSIFVPLNLDSVFVYTTVDPNLAGGQADAAELVRRTAADIIAVLQPQIDADISKFRQATGINISNWEYAALCWKCLYGTAAGNPAARGSITWAILNQTAEIAATTQRPITIQYWEDQTAQTATYQPIWWDAWRNTTDAAQALEIFKIHAADFHPGSVTVALSVTDDGYDIHGSMQYIFNDPRYRNIHMPQTDEDTLSDYYTNAIDLSCIVSADGGVDTFSAIDLQPKLWYSHDGKWYWSVGGLKTSILAQGPAGKSGTNKGLMVVQRFENIVYHPVLKIRGNSGTVVHTVHEWDEGKWIGEYQAPVVSDNHINISYVPCPSSEWGKYALGFDPSEHAFRVRMISLDNRSIWRPSQADQITSPGVINQTSNVKHYPLPNNTDWQNLNPEDLTATTYTTSTQYIPRPCVKNELQGDNLEALDGTPCIVFPSNEYQYGHYNTVFWFGTLKWVKYLYPNASENCYGLVVYCSDENKVDLSLDEHSFQGMMRELDPYGMHYTARLNHVKPRGLMLPIGSAYVGRILNKFSDNPTIDLSNKSVEIDGANRPVSSVTGADVEWAAHLIYADTGVLHNKTVQDIDPVTLSQDLEPGANTQGEALERYGVFDKKILHIGSVKDIRSLDAANKDFAAIPERPKNFHGTKDKWTAPVTPDGAPMTDFGCQHVYNAEIHLDEPVTITAFRDFYHLDNLLDVEGDVSIGYPQKNTYNANEAVLRSADDRNGGLHVHGVISRGHGNSFFKTRLPKITLQDPDGSALNNIPTEFGGWGVWGTSGYHKTPIAGYRYKVPFIENTTFNLGYFNGYLNGPNVNARAYFGAEIAHGLLARWVHAREGLVVMNERGIPTFSTDVDGNVQVCGGEIRSNNTNPVWHFIGATQVGNKDFTNKKLFSLYYESNLNGAGAATTHTLDDMAGGEAPTDINGAYISYHLGVTQGANIAAHRVSPTWYGSWRRDGEVGYNSFQFLPVGEGSSKIGMTYTDDRGFIHPIWSNLALDADTVSVNGSFQAFGWSFLPATVGIPARASIYAGNGAIASGVLKVYDPNRSRDNYTYGDIYLSQDGIKVPADDRCTIHATALLNTTPEPLRSGTSKRAAFIDNHSGNRWITDLPQSTIPSSSNTGSRLSWTLNGTIYKGTSANYDIPKDSPAVQVTSPMTHVVKGGSLNVGDVMTLGHEKVSGCLQVGQALDVVGNIHASQSAYINGGLHVKRSIVTQGDVYAAGDVIAHKIARKIAQKGQIMNADGSVTIKSTAWGDKNPDGTDVTPSAPIVLDLASNTPPGVDRYVHFQMGRTGSGGPASSSLDGNFRYIGKLPMMTGFVSKKRFRYNLPPYITASNARNSNYTTNLGFGKYNYYTGKYTVSNTTISSLDASNPSPDDKSCGLRNDIDVIYSRSGNTNVLDIVFRAIPLWYFCKKYSGGKRCPMYNGIYILHRTQEGMRVHDTDHGRDHFIVWPAEMGTPSDKLYINIPGGTSTPLRLGPTSGSHMTDVILPTSDDGADGSLIGYAGKYYSRDGGDVEIRTTPAISAKLTKQGYIQITSASDEGYIFAGTDMSGYKNAEYDLINAINNSPQFQSATLRFVYTTDSVEPVDSGQADEITYAITQELNVGNFDSALAGNVANPLKNEDELGAWMTAIDHAGPALITIDASAKYKTIVSETKPTQSDWDSVQWSVYKHYSADTRFTLNVTSTLRQPYVAVHTDAGINNGIAQDESFVVTPELPSTNNITIPMWVEDVSPDNIKIRENNADWRFANITGGFSRELLSKYPLAIVGYNFSPADQSVLAPIDASTSGYLVDPGLIATSAVSSLFSAQKNNFVDLTSYCSIGAAGTSSFAIEIGSLVNQYRYIMLESSGGANDQSPIYWVLKVNTNVALGTVVQSDNGGYGGGSGTGGSGTGEYSLQRFGSSLVLSVPYSWWVYQGVNHPLFDIYQNADPNHRSHISDEMSTGDPESGTVAYPCRSIMDANTWGKITMTSSDLCYLGTGNYVLSSGGTSPSTPTGSPVSSYSSVFICDSLPDVLTRIKIHLGMFSANDQIDQLVGGIHAPGATASDDNGKSVVIQFANATFVANKLSKITYNAGSQEYRLKGVLSVTTPKTVFVSSGNFMYRGDFPMTMCFTTGNCSISVPTTTGNISLLRLTNPS